ncbi:MAG: orotidine 5'-phosphate decarboxylase, partial [Planctomycetota bacterium]|nr:orotidine 5'-phosphate decarboxylase [Planctomycetota bacterium]
DVYKRQILPRETLIVTPGIRLGESPDDQKRVATPQVALEAGANLLVVGRPIIEDKNPLQSAERFFREITSALEKLKR